MNAPIVKWRVPRWGNEPRREEFIRETEHMLFSEKRGRLSRTHKVTDYHRYFDTEAEALAVITERLARESAEKDAKRIRDAAHDLLEALELVAAWGPPCCLSADEAKTFAADQEKARAAIAKARGEA